jgi:transcriptional regulator with XRE-family HTH domain
VTTWEPTWPGQRTGVDSLASRIGILRTREGMTQQQLADRLGVSRVAISHLEAGINSPDARTVTLLASVFGTEPHDLVAGTDYPIAKVDRLPLVVARRTEVGHQVALMEADLAWVEGPDAVVADRAVADDLRQRWRVTLAKLAATVADPDEAATLDAARSRLDAPPS